MSEVLKLNLVFWRNVFWLCCRIRILLEIAYIVI